MAQKQIDVLSVGDVVTDAFIRLLDKEERVEHKKDGENWLAIPFGTKSLLTTPKSSKVSVMPPMPRWLLPGWA
jgi:hypothetical protein